jgi:hypothetical protein
MTTLWCQQNVAFVAAVRHAQIDDISGHFENLVNGVFDAYAMELRRVGLKIGVELDDHPWVKEASLYDVEYFIFHCRDWNAD